MEIKCPKCDTENTEDSQFCKKCATHLPSLVEAQPSFTKTLETPVEELTRGTLFADRYEIIEELGTGGMGKVYRVEDIKTKEEIALKLIKPEIAIDKKTIERFRSELTTARKIAHRNVCRMFDLGEDQGTHFITMEYVSGGDLKRFIRRAKRLDTGTAISIAKQICEGLAEAHSLGVVHRDLKPNNIMIDDDGNVRIMDFGIARSLSAKGITGAGVMIGTPEYMSPEQVEAKDVDQRSDIYSLGIILYEMTTGRLPFEADTPFAVGVKHKSEEPESPKDINPQIPDDLSRVILRCLEKNKEVRYQSAGEVRSALANIEKGIPTTEKKAPVRKPLTSKEITVQLSLKRLLIPALIIIAIVIVGMMIWSPWIKKETIPITSDKPSIAVLPFEDLSPQRDQGYLCDGLAESLINALSKIKELRVPARTSSFSFKGEDYVIRDIGEKLNVASLLVGSLQMAGNRIRITTQLINVVDESLLWSEQYNRELDDVFNIQDEITLNVVEILKVKLIGGERAALVKRNTSSVEAYKLFLKGKHFRWIENKEGFLKAKEYFELAIEEDPNYSSAYAGLAEVYMLLGLFSMLPREEAALQAKNAAWKALELDRNLSEAHSSMGVILEIFDWDWEEAEREFTRAIDLNPSNYNAHYEYGALLTRTKRLNKAEDEIKKAQQIDPLSHHSHRWLITIYRLKGDLNKAEEQRKKRDELDPLFTKDEDAVARAEKLIKRDGRLPQHLRTLAIAHMGSGEKSNALRVIDELKDLYDKSDIGNIALYTAICLIALDEKDQALTWLERAFEKRDPLLVMINTVSSFEVLHQEPRFKAIQAKMGLD